MTSAGPAVPVGSDIVVGPALPVGGAAAGPGVVIVPAGQDPIRHTHVQDVPQAVWPIPHGKGRPPIAWVLRDQEGIECWGYTVQLLDDDTARVSMEDPTAGTIHLIF